MRKIHVVTLFLVVIMLLAACSSTGSGLTSPMLEDFIEAYRAEGVEVDPEVKQYYAMAEAIDGVIFYIDNKPVKIYEYASVKDLEKYKKEDSTVTKWPVNGRFLLETSSEKAKEIFNSVK